jgi:hypothetical protein
MDTRDLRADHDFGGPDPLADEKPWPRWAVTLGVVTFCAAFWIGVSFIATKLLG